MKSLYFKWLLTALLLFCFAPASFAAWNNGCDKYWSRDCQPKPQCRIPEGGSTAVYLLGAGLICAGGMFVRSRSTRPNQS